MSLHCIGKLVSPSDPVDKMACMMVGSFSLVFIKERGNRTHSFQFIIVLKDTHQSYYSIAEYKVEILNKS